MRPKEAWGRVQSPTKETGLERPKDVFSRKQTGYSMWTEAMKAAIGQLRRAERKWYALYDKVIAHLDHFRATASPPVLFSGGD